MTVLGIDAKKTRLVGVVLTQPDDLPVVFRKLIPANLHHACAQAADWSFRCIEVNAYLDQHQLSIDLVALEAPFIHFKNTNGSIPIALVNGALRAGVPEHITLADVPPTRWKAQTVGKGNATKDEVTAWVRATYGLRVVEALKDNGKHDQDATDAFCIAQYGLKLQTLKLGVEAGTLEYKIKPKPTRRAV